MNTRGKRWVKTENFELTCDGLKDTWGNIFGHCEILISRNRVMSSASNLNFAISKSEGEKALAHFVKPSSAENILIKAPMSDENDESFEQEKSSFIFEANWKHQMIGAVLDRRLVAE